MCEPIHEVVREVLLRRRSVRAYQPDPIEDATLLSILECTRQAPSAANRQPWHFVVARDPARRRDVAEACNSQMWIADAGAVVVALGIPAVSERWYRVDVAIGLENLVIAAASHGLGTCWVGAFDESRVKQAIGAPEEVTVVAVTPLGVPKGDWPAPRSRKDFGLVFSADAYGQPLKL
ncbi:MAG: nitroreductase family protein [Anaerolineae bacterium]